MDYKDIVDKALKGEDYAELTKDFDAVKLREVDLAISKAAKAEAVTELEKVSGIRKERQRLENPPKPEENGQGQLRVENIQIAKERFFADSKFKMSDEEKVQFEVEFKKLDSGKIAPELILNDLKKAYAVVNSDKLISSGDRIAEFEKNAAQYNADGAGGSGGQGSPDDTKYSQAAKDIHKSWIKAGIKTKSLDDAQKLADRGGDWKERDLSS